MWTAGVRWTRAPATDGPPEGPASRYITAMSSGEGDGREPRAGAVAFAYASNFAALSSSAPFFAVCLADRGFGEESVSSLLAALLLVNVACRRWSWTRLADGLGVDRLGAPAVSFGALACAIPAFFGSPGVLVVGLLGLGACRAPFGALLDALLLRSGRRFGPIRAWGTAGYVLGALVTGFLTTRVGVRGIALSTVGSLTLAALAALFVPGASRSYARARRARAPRGPAARSARSSGNRGSVFSSSSPFSPSWGSPLTTRSSLHTSRISRMESSPPRRWPSARVRSSYFFSAWGGGRADSARRASSRLRARAPRSGGARSRSSRRRPSSSRPSCFMP